MPRIKLIFAVFGDLLNPELFSKLANLAPTSCWFKGDIVPNRQNLTRKETCWEYSFDFIETLFFEDISNLFIQQFGTNAEKIARYVKKNNLKTKIYVVIEIYDNENKPALFFENNFVNMAAKLNCAIDTDLYYFDNV